MSNNNTPSIQVKKYKIIALIALLTFIIAFIFMIFDNKDKYTTESFTTMLICFFIGIYGLLYSYLLDSNDTRGTYKVRLELKINENKEEITIINEILDTLNIYKTNETDKMFVENFVSKKLSSLRDSYRYKDFSYNTLNSSAQFKIFVNSLKIKKDSINENNKELESKLEKLNSENNKINEKSKETKQLIEIATERLLKEVELLKKSGNIYIVFGSLITLVAGVVLFYTVEDLLKVYDVGTKDGVNSTINTFDIASIIIRFSIVIFIEFFAYYYLKLYKTIMDNIKYYQNEITNIEMKLISLAAVEKSNCKDTLQLLASELVKTERNFVIDKNKTTVDIEKSKADSSIMQSTTDNMVKILKSIKS